MRTALLPLLAAGALAGYVLLAIQVLRSAEGEEAWPVGASPRALVGLAESRIEEAVETLNAQEGPVEGRLAGYRSGLEEAERDLVRSLETLPGQPRTLARLAAVRSEQSFGAASSERSNLALISLAARLAPDAPAIQEQMGTLLLRLGERDAAGEYLKKAVRLDPARAGNVVYAMSEDLFTPDEILETLPRSPQTLLALQRPFYDAGRIEEYADLLEASLPGSVELLRAYGRACLWAKEGERLAAEMERLAPAPEPLLEAERLVQLSRAHQATGDLAGAVEDARRATRVAGEDPAVFENLGMISLAADDPKAALEAFGAALSELARRSRAVMDRARLYRMIGVAEERRQARDRAYDAYKKALELDPTDPVAKRRVLEMEKAAGLPEPETP